MGGIKYNLDGAIPGTRAKCVLGDEVPMNGEDLPLMLLPGLDGELVERYVEELNGAIACGNDELVLVRFGPGDVVEGVLGIEP